MPWIRETYEQVKVTAVRNLPCPICGKKFRRQRTFINTINPFNRNADGSPKNRREVLAAVSAKAFAWSATPEKCPGCAEVPGA